MRKTRGFTLLEVLLAVTIVVIVTAAMSATIGVSFDLKRSAETAVNESKDIMAVGDSIVKDLASCVQPNPASTITDITVTIPNYFAGPFIGGPQDLTFYASGAEPKSTIPSDMRFIEFTLANDGNGTALVRNVNPNILGDPTNTTESQQILIHNVVSLTFRYFDGMDWYDNWDTTQQNNVLPLAVSVRLELQPLVAGGPNRVIERYVPLWCAVPSTQDTGGSTGLL